MDDSEVFDRLIAAALRAGHRQETVDEEAVLMGSLASPEWEQAGRVHEWRNHVDEAVIKVWDDLPVLAQLVAFIAAETAASAEEWE